jgi:predicted XRE-type DNA-binding protein
MLSNEHWQAKFCVKLKQGEQMADVQISGVMPHYVDPTVEHVGVSKLRQLNATNLGKLKNMLVVQDNDTALAVVIRYEQYLAMQNQLEDALRTIKAYGSDGFTKGLQDAAAGKIKRMAEVDPTL